MHVNKYYLQYFNRIKASVRIRMALALNKLQKKPPSEVVVKPKKKVDRFDGLTEEEVQKNTLQDILRPDLDLVFVGINPSLMAAHRGRYYAGPGNHFYKLLHASGLVPRFVSFEEDRELLKYSIGLTNIVARATRSSADLKKSEIKEGAAIVREKLRTLRAKIAVFNGKCIYEVFAEKSGKTDFYFGLQPERVGETAIWVVPSSSARCAHFPRMVDKLHFYLALKKHLSFLKGEISSVNMSEFRFEGKCKQSVATTSIMWRRKNPSAFLHGGRVANKGTVGLDTSEEDIGILKSKEFIVTEILTGNDEKPSSSQDNEDAPETEYSEETKSFSEEKLSQESENENIVSSGDSTLGSSPRKPGKNLKRPWTQARTTLPCNPRSSNDTPDFVNLIKSRLSGKKEKTDSQEEISKTQHLTKEVKKLKYSNLRRNVGKNKMEDTPKSANNSDSFCND